MVDRAQDARRDPDALIFFGCLPGSPSGRPRLAASYTSLMMDVLLGIVDRGWVAESHHRGRISVVREDGRVLLSLGDMTVPTLPRSALKPFQAIAMLRSGLDLENQLLALAAASHLGQSIHTEGALRILEMTGLSTSDFQHTADLPGDAASLAAWLAAGRRKEPLAHNCSGKHAAMLRTCRLAGWSIEGYRDPSHPLQQAIRAVIEEYCGVLGCTAPAVATTLPGLARGFARLASEKKGPGRLVADAFRRYPEYTSGTSHPVVRLVEQVPGVVAKVGAEGILAVGLPEGIGIAVKISDGMGRGRFEVVDAILTRLGHPVISRPGEVRISPELEENLASLNG